MLIPTSKPLETGMKAMTFQTSHQAFQSSAVALGGLAEPRSFRDLLDEAQRVPPADLTQARAVIARLAELAGAQVVIAPQPAPNTLSSDLGGLPVWKARKIRDHIEARLDGTIRNTELAALANLSASYFCRAFKKTFGESAHLYILRRRVALSQTLMRQGRQALADIALTCGFADQAHMTRVFSRLVGTSPSRWRRQHAPLPQ